MNGRRSLINEEWFYESQTMSHFVKKDAEHALSPPASPPSSRRAFLKRAAAAGPMVALPGAFGHAPALGHARPTPTPVRVRGRVREAGSNDGIGGVVVTDGLNVVQTSADGTYELVSDGRRPFAYLSLPRGYRIPTQADGTAKLYRPIEPDGEGEAEATFELERRRQPGTDHAFFLLADPQTENEEEVRRFHEQTVPDVRQRAAGREGQPVFGIGCGDLMFDNLDLFPTYEEAVQMMGVPFFQVIGNHDLDFDGATDPASSETFRRYFGPTYYSFNVGEVHYVVLDDVFWNGRDYVGYLGADQLAWLEQDLALLEDGQTVVVSHHIPAKSTRSLRAGEDEPPATGSISNREALYALLEPFEAHLLAGHVHETEHVFDGGTHEHVHGTVCGAWWSGPICYDGTPKGYGVYEARGSELRWHYQSTGHDADHQLRVYERGADPDAPREIVANVWNWDPEWEVDWYENGARRGRMARRTGLDPLSVKLHAGEDEPERQPWVDPVPTDHLFYAPVSDDARNVRVEATDRFGRTYTARLGEEAGNVPADDASE